jgi:hypothetical protein
MARRAADAAACAAGELLAHRALDDLNTQAEV